MIIGQATCFIQTLKLQRTFDLQVVWDGGNKLEVSVFHLLSSLSRIKMLHLVSDNLYFSLLYRRHQLRLKLQQYQLSLKNHSFKKFEYNTYWNSIGRLDLKSECSLQSLLCSEHYVLNRPWTLMMSL